MSLDEWTWLAVILAFLALFGEVLFVWAVELLLFAMLCAGVMAATAVAVIEWLWERLQDLVEAVNG